MVKNLALVFAALVILTTAASAQIILGIPSEHEHHGDREHRSGWRDHDWGHARDRHRHEHRHHHESEDEDHD